MFLVRDDENDYDLYAVQVKTESGQMIGWIPQSKSYSVGKFLDQGGIARAIVISRSVSTEGNVPRGVNIEVALLGDDILKEEDTPAEDSQPMDKGVCLALAILVGFVAMVLIAAVAC